MVIALVFTLVGLGAFVKKKGVKVKKKTKPEQNRVDQKKKNTIRERERVDGQQKTDIRRIQRIDDAVFTL